MTPTPTPDISAVDIGAIALVLILVLERIFSFLKPILDERRMTASDNNNGNGRVTLAEIKRDIAHVTEKLLNIEDIQREYVRECKKRDERLVIIERWMAVHDARVAARAAAEKSGIETQGD